MTSPEQSDSGWPVDPETTVPLGFKLRGVGAYGSDVDVVTLEAYLELHQRYLWALESCQKWAARVTELEPRERRS